MKVPETLPRFVSVGDARPDDPARGRDLALPELGVPGDGPHRARRLPRHPRRRHRDLGRRGRPARARSRASCGKRRFGAVVRLEVSSSISRAMVAPTDRAARRSGPDAVYPVHGLLDLRESMQLYEPRPPRPEVRAVGAAHAAPPGQAEGRATCSRRSRQRDIVVQHPYDSFATSVEAFVRAAANDPAVVTLKTTVYRTSHDSALAPALIEAAENGKQSVCIVELKARFDERAQHRVGALARAGRRPRRLRVPGPEDPREDDARDPHARATASSATSTSAPATTTRRRRGSTRTSASSPPIRTSPPTSPTCSTSSPASAARSAFRKILVAPFNLRRELVERIRNGRRRRGRRRARADPDQGEQPRRPGIVEELYRASQAGAEDRPDRPCRLRAPAGRRGAERADPRPVDPRPLPRAQPALLLRGRRERSYLLGSADLMQRNLDHRIEVVVPVEAAARAGRDRDDLPARFSPTTRRRGCWTRTASWERARPDERRAEARLAARRDARAHAGASPQHSGRSRSERFCRHVAAASWGDARRRHRRRVEHGPTPRLPRRRGAPSREGDAPARRGDRADGPIHRDKLAETAQFVAKLARDARVRGVSRLEVLVTSPGRQAANGDELLARLAAAAGAPVRLLSAEEEGRLGVHRRAVGGARRVEAPGRGMRRRRWIGAGRGRDPP